MVSKSNVSNIRIIRFCSLKISPKLVLYVLAQIMLQYCIYGNTSVQYSDRRAVAEINDLILFITPIDFAVTFLEQDFHEYEHQGML